MKTTPNGQPYQNIVVRGRRIGDEWQHWMHDQAVLGKANAEWFITHYLEEVRTVQNRLITATPPVTDFVDPFANLEIKVAAQNGAWIIGF
jgi:hypothetical protein